MRRLALPLSTLRQGMERRSTVGPKPDRSSGIAADIEIAPEFYTGLLRQAEGVLIEDQVAWPLLFYPASVMSKAKYSGLSPNAAHIHLLRYLAPPP